jgi:DNA ligase (NAD+)
MCITWSFIWIDWIKIARDDLAKKLESVWWDFISSVSKNTNFLLAGDKAWSKLKKANDLWVTVINLEEFLKEVEK